MVESTRAGAGTRWGTAAVPYASRLNPELRWPEGART